MKSSHNEFQWKPFINQSTCLRKENFLYTTKTAKNSEMPHHTISYKNLITPIFNAQTTKNPHRNNPKLSPLQLKPILPRLDTHTDHHRNTNDNHHWHLNHHKNKPQRVENPNSLRGPRACCTRCTWPTPVVDRSSNPTKRPTGLRSLHFRGPASHSVSRRMCVCASAIRIEIRKSEAFRVFECVYVSGWVFVVFQ